MGGVDKTGEEIGEKCLWWYEIQVKGKKLTMWNVNGANVLV